MERYETTAHLEAALQHILARDARLKPLHARHGTPALRNAPATLATLLQIVCEQFLSLKAAEAIWKRVKKHMGRVTPENVLACTEADLLALGLSRGKIRCFHACAASGVKFGSLKRRSAEEVRKELLAIKGIGPWTADIFLMAALGHADAWPCGDVALQAAAHSALKLRKRPSAKQLEKLGEKWRPHRAAAARLLWMHYRDIKGMPQPPSQD